MFKNYCLLFKCAAKPQNIESFLRKTVDELNDCIANGVTVDDRKVAVRVKMFVCDSPARALIKGRSSSLLLYSSVFIIN